MINNDECIPQEKVEDLLEQGMEVLIIDVRDASEYNENHIVQAVNIPINNILEILDQISSDTLVVTVCGNGGGRSEKAADILQIQGLKNVGWLCNGTFGWN